MIEVGGVGFPGVVNGRRRDPRAFGGGQSFGGTPTGTYTIVITASSAQATLTSTVTLTVR